VTSYLPGHGFSSKVGMLCCVAVLILFCVILLLRVRVMGILLKHCDVGISREARWLSLVSTGVSFWWRLLINERSEATFRQVFAPWMCSNLLQVIETLVSCLMAQLHRYFWGGIVFYRGIGIFVFYYSSELDEKTCRNLVMKISD